MKNKKGFTLVELLAVIVVLGVVMTIAGTAALKIKKNANIEEAKQLEKTLKELGPNLFSYEMSKGSNSNFYVKYKALLVTNSTTTTNNKYSITIPVSELSSKGYLKSANISNPAGGEVCSGFLRVIKNTSGPIFVGKICCPNLYDSNGNDGVDCTNFKKNSTNLLSE